MERYLTVGTDFITPMFFKNIIDSDTSDIIKPSGGLWLTSFNEKSPTANEWIWFLMSHLNVYFYKFLNKSDIFNMPCSIVNLKEHTNIFKLNSMADFDYLLTHYPATNDWFSYESLSNDFDGIFINLSSLKKEDFSVETKLKLTTFAVNTLILFNYNCIKCYQSAKLCIEPFDFEYGLDDVDINLSMEINSESKEIINKNNRYDDLLSMICDYLQKHFNVNKDGLSFEKVYNKEEIFRVILNRFSTELESFRCCIPELYNNQYSSEELCNSIMRRIIKKDI